MSFGKPVPLRLAAGVASDLVLALADCCARVEIVGSVRRKKPMVGDVELLVIPFATAQMDMFGAPLGPISLLNGTLDRLVANGLNWGWSAQPRRGEKWKRLVHRPTGIPADIFVTTPRAWAANLIVRTGPSDFSAHMMSTAKRMGYHFADGFLLHGHSGPCPDGPDCGRILESQTEQDVFDHLRLPWRTPEQRQQFPPMPRPSPSARPQPKAERDE